METDLVIGHSGFHLQNKWWEIVFANHTTTCLLEMHKDYAYFQLIDLSHANIQKLDYAAFTLIVIELAEIAKSPDVCFQ